MVTGDEWWRLLPPETSCYALRVLAARGVGASIDGFVAGRLPTYLVEIRSKALAVRHPRRMLLVAASVLMAAIGAALATVTAFWPLLVRPCRPSIWRVVVFILALMTPWRANAEPPSLVLEKTIPLPNVGGRIDHMAIDRKRMRLIVAALGNDTVEIVDLAAGKSIYSIRGLAAPEGVAYVDQTDIIFAANAGDGSVRTFRGEDLGSLDWTDLRRDADNIRIDARNGNIVVGYGDGSLAIIDPTTRTASGTVALRGHPEGFQIDPTTGHAFVNVPDDGQIAVVDLDARQQIATWKVPGAGGNYPMALDSARAVLAAVFRSPPSLVLLDTKTGTVTARLPACGDADDVFFDVRRERIYVSCGSGEIAVF